MPYLSGNIKDQVRVRADNRCEYCRLHQVSQVAIFHIDHIVPVKEGGSDELDNLALACVSCSLHKGAKISELDPLTDSPQPVFHPRNMSWEDHFSWEDYHLIGLTPIGRATVLIIKPNRPLVLGIRKEEEFWGRFP